MLEQDEEDYSPKIIKKNIYYDEIDSAKKK